MAKGFVSFWIRVDLKEKLKKLKKEKESYNEVIERLISFYEQHNSLTQQPPQPQTQQPSFSQ